MYCKYHHKRRVLMVTSVHSAHLWANGNSTHLSTPASMQYYCCFALHCPNSGFKTRLIIHNSQHIPQKQHSRYTFTTACSLPSSHPICFQGASLLKTRFCLQITQQYVPLTVILFNNNKQCTNWRLKKKNINKHTSKMFLWYNS